MTSRLRTTVPAWLATLLTILLVASGITIGGTPAIAAPAPSIAVSTAPNGGGQVTVTGSGFTPANPGVYVGIGPAGATSFYTAAISDTVWVALANEDGATADGRTAKLNADGTFVVTLTVAASTADVPAYAVYTSKAHGLGMADPSQNSTSPVVFAPAPEPEPEPVESTLSVSKSVGLDPAGEAITVTGAGYTIDSAGVYAQVGWIKPGEWTPVSAEQTRSENRVGVKTAWISGPRQPAWVVAEDGTGSFTWTVTVAKAEVEAKAEDGFILAAFTLGAHGNFVQPNNEHFVALSFTTPTVPVPPVVEPAPPVVAAGSLIWGVKQSFRNYVTSSIAQGAISVSGVRSVSGSFVFGQASGSTFNGSTGTSSYSGSVRFTGHGGVLDLRLANPVVRVDSARSATLLLTVNGSTVPFATLALGSSRTVNGAVTYSGVPATLTAQGASAFVNGDSQFYPAGTALDPVTFTIGSPRAVGGGAQTIAAFVAVANGVPPTPPASNGITLQRVSPDGLQDGDEVTITADGFEPNEQGIKVVVYSDPVILAANATADARGVVTWTGRLPSGLTGDHTLTLQGSVDRGVVISIAERTMMTTSMSGCVVSDATITWGFKEAFRSYVSGAIAHGEWTVADGATYDIPNFGWNDGSGTYDPASAQGLVTFTGAVTFTGHGGVLGTTISNPQLRFDDAETATLLLDVAGDTRDGVAVDQPAVEFATIDLSAAEITTDAGEHTISAAPAVLTEAGSAAFGTYEAGTELDPITIAYSTEADCAPDVMPTDDASEVSEKAAAGPGWLIWVIVAAALVALAAIAWALAARRRRQN